jgi:hypothetical protein
VKNWQMSCSGSMRSARSARRTNVLRSSSWIDFARASTLAALLFALAGCSSNVAGTLDDAGALEDAGSPQDGGPIAVDGGDGGVDAGALDGGVDAGSDAGAPAGPDAGPSAATACTVEPMTEIYSGIFPPNPYSTTGWPAGNCAVPHDALVLLGCPSNDGGTPSPCQQFRVQFALELQDAGYADEFIVSGAAVHNQYIEADSLKSQLLAAGVPSDHIFEDLLAQHTDENIYYSDKIMEAQAGAPPSSSRKIPASSSRRRSAIPTAASNWAA